MELTDEEKRELLLEKGWGEIEAFAVPTPQAKEDTSYTLVEASDMLEALKEGSKKYYWKEGISLCGYGTHLFLEDAFEEEQEIMYEEIEERYDNLDPDQLEVLLDDKIRKIIRR